MNRTHEIPEPFYRDAAGIVVVLTVGELKKVIADLPDDLPIDEDCQRLVVPNIKTDPYLTFEEADIY
jgi:hypothetical protein